jgi:hypothetical protein
MTGHQHRIRTTTSIARWMPAAPVSSYSTCRTDKRVLLPSGLWLCELTPGLHVNDKQVEYP